MESFLPNFSSTIVFDLVPPSPVALSSPETCGPGPVGALGAGGRRDLSGWESVWMSNTRFLAAGTQTRADGSKQRVASPPGGLLFCFFYQGGQVGLVNSLFR